MDGIANLISQSLAIFFENSPVESLKSLVGNVDRFVASRKT